MSKGKPRGGSGGGGNPKKTGKGKARPVDASVQKAIGNRLRAYYNAVAQEPVPDRFVELLKQLNGEDPAKA